MKAFDVSKALILGGTHHAYVSQSTEQACRVIRFLNEGDLRVPLNVSRRSAAACPVARIIGRFGYKARISRISTSPFRSGKPISTTTASTPPGTSSILSIASVAEPAVSTLKPASCVIRSHSPPMLFLWLKRLNRVGSSWQNVPLPIRIGCQQNPSWQGILRSCADGYAWRLNSLTLEEGSSSIRLILRPTFPHPGTSALPTDARRHP